ncbi:dihydroorotase [Desulfonispora thiosulfatigenes DSM 11270]|uniref:Dihydroorotase n=1 Tax=Desulfonispora thiosulfatigenes DSM 11270 TaxID=656914 RepID=A0A1W1VGZ3_DESTI|nr:dihydroorotase [Desulfonispora thiosulfatigenes]SMB92586.1 dihydroorotase [Desulfonispora thiosulfatigenes DSM 11270]
MLLIKNGLVIDPSQNINETLDILIENKKILKIEKNIKANKDMEVINANGMIVAPGFIDLHVHLREPGKEYKETILTGCQAAAKGGFTGIACMPNTSPVIDNESVVELIKARANKYNLVDVYPIASITKGQEGKELTEYGILKETGAIAFSDDGVGVSSSGVMRRALDYAKAFDALIMCHCEDESLAGDGVMHEGVMSTKLGLAGIPSIAEEIMLERDIALAEFTKGKIHICHVSTAKGVEIIRNAKNRGVRVTAEVTPHHISLTDEAVKDYDPNTKVNPPLRTKEDIDALIEGLIDGTIDCIATDHAPHSIEEKEVEYDYAPFGMVGLETAVPIAFEKLVKTNKLDYLQIVKVLSTSPAKILGLDKGSLREGTEADITIIDPNLTQKVDVNKFYTLGKNTPFNNLELTGWPVYTIKDGNIIMNQGVVVE